MANYNKIVLVGNLTRDPQMRYLPSQTAVVDFGLAVNHKFKTKSGEDKEEVLFVDCVAFGKPGEVINQYCQKGKQLLIEGRLKFDTWEDKQGGGKRSKHSVVVENFQFLGDRAGGQSAGGERQQSRPPQQRPSSAPPLESEQSDASEGKEYTEDDIPF
jgi:single-strand DNA-binding protein